MRDAGSDREIAVPCQEARHADVLVQSIPVNPGAGLAYARLLPLPRSLS